MACIYYFHLNTILIIIINIYTTTLGIVCDKSYSPILAPIVIKQKDPYSGK